MRFLVGTEVREVAEVDAAVMAVHLLAAEADTGAIIADIDLDIYLFNGLWARTRTYSA